MPNVNITLSDSGFPDPFVGDAQELKDAFLDNLTAEIDTDNLLFGQIGGTAPSTDIGLWLDTNNGGILKYHNGSAYVPVKITIGNATDTVTLLAASLTEDRTATFPNKSGTIALTSDVFTPRSTIVIAAGGTKNLDWSLSNSFFLNLTAATTINSINSQPGQQIMLAISKPDTFTVTFPGSWLFQGGSNIAITTGTTDLFIARNTAGSIYVQQLQDFS